MHHLHLAFTIYLLPLPFYNLLFKYIFVWTDKGKGQWADMVKRPLAFGKGGNCGCAEATSPKLQSKWAPVTVVILLGTLCFLAQSQDE